MAESRVFVPIFFHKSNLADSSDVFCLQQFALAGNNWNDGDGYVKALPWLPSSNASAAAANEALARSDLLSFLPVNASTLDRALSLYKQEDFVGGWNGVAGAVRQDVIFAW